MEKPFKTLNDKVQKGKGSSNLDIKKFQKMCNNFREL